MLAGPNNLLGRYALEQLWPAEYKALRNVAVNSGSAVSIRLISSEKSSGGKSLQQCQSGQQRQVARQESSVLCVNKQWSKPVCVPDKQQQQQKPHQQKQQENVNG